MIPLLSDYIISVSCAGLFLCVLDPFGAAAVKQSAGGEKKKTISVSPWRRSVRSIFPWETCGARLPSLCNSRRPTYLQGSSSATNTLVPLIPLILIICYFSITPPGTVKHPAIEEKRQFLSDCKCLTLVSSALIIFFSFIKSRMRTFQLVLRASCSISRLTEKVTSQLNLPWSQN